MGRAGLEKNRAIPSKKSYIENLFDKYNLEMINSLSSINDSKEIRNLLISLKGIGP